MRIAELNRKEKSNRDCKQKKVENDADSIKKLKSDLIRKFVNERITPDDMMMLLSLCDILENGDVEQQRVLSKKLPRKLHSALKEALPWVSEIRLCIEALIKDRLGPE